MHQSTLFDGLGVSRNGGYSTAFSAWWDIYPRKVGKRAAQTAWDRSLRRICHENGMSRLEAIDWLLDTTKTYSTSKSGQSGVFTPHPSTWLNQDRYFDDQETWGLPSKLSEKVISDNEIAESVRFRLIKKFRGKVSEVDLERMICQETARAIAKSRGLDGEKLSDPISGYVAGRLSPA